MGKSLPLLIVVTGRPGSGKTTLAHALAKAIRCPAICRDEIKEGLVNTTGQSGQGGDEIAWQVYDAFFDTMELLLRRNITLIAEAAFQRKLWMPKLDEMRQFARIRIVICNISPDLGRGRQIARDLADPDRERFHHDSAALAAAEHPQLSLRSYDPPQSDLPTMIVDTSNGYQSGFEQIVSFASPFTE